jgi:hypothetical protein
MEPKHKSMGLTPKSVACNESAFASNNPDTMSGQPYKDARAIGEMPAKIVVLVKSIQSKEEKRKETEKKEEDKIKNMW